MSQVYLQNGLVLPLQDDTTYDPGVVVFEGNRITYAGPAAGAPSPAPGAVLFDCQDRIVLPGLVNTHTHAGMTYFRNLLEDLPSADWFSY